MSTPMPAPVKDEIYPRRHPARPARQRWSPAISFRVPQDPLIERVAAGSRDGCRRRLDCGTRAEKAISSLRRIFRCASRCVKAGAEVIAPNGKPFTETIDRDDAGGFAT